MPENWESFKISFPPLFLTIVLKAMNEQVLFTLPLTALILTHLSAELECLLAGPCPVGWLLPHPPFPVLPLPA